MSRAFMKERDDAPDPEPRLEHSGPFRATPKGMAALRRRLEAAATPAERQALQYRISMTEVIEPPQGGATVAFGATVTVEIGGKPQTFTLVDESEVDVPSGKIGLESPLGQALSGAKVGDAVLWRRPAGEATVTVRAITY